MMVVTWARRDDAGIAVRVPERAAGLMIIAPQSAQSGRD
jgi:hypothetical protein